ncbi:MAG: hypothetical protein V4772_19785 [Pseudomonadota bacterium]
MDSQVIQLLQALGFFKDWTNYLLVTTVAALGWIATKPVLIDGMWLKSTIFFFCLSIVFAIFTLGLIPVVGESITKDAKSIYEVAGEFKLIWTIGPEVALTLKWVCWPQHVFFVVGICLFSLGSIWRIPESTIRKTGTLEPESENETKVLNLPSTTSRA